MELKAKYRGKNKKLNHKKITNYEQLRSAIKKSFPDSPEDCIIFYNDEDGHIDVQNDDDFQLLFDPPRKTILFVRHKDQDATDIMELSMIQPKSTINDSGVKGPQEWFDIKDQVEESEQKYDCIKRKPQRSQTKVQETEKPKPIYAQEPEKQKPKDVEKPEKQKPKDVEKSEISKPFEEEKPQKLQKPKSQKIQVQEKSRPVNNFIHKGTKCDFCSTPDIKGSRFKCIACTDYELCSDCYLTSKYKSGKEHKSKNHDFIEIQDETFWNRLNFSHSIRKLFNSQYRISQTDMRVGNWISQEDIANCNINFVDQVWRCSQPMAKKVLQGFQQWSQENKA